MGRHLPGAYGILAISRRRHAVPARLRKSLATLFLEILAITLDDELKNQTDLRFVKLGDLNLQFMGPFVRIAAGRQSGSLCL